MHLLWEMLAMGNSLWLGVQYPFEGYSAEKLLLIMRLPEYRQYIKVQAELKKIAARHTHSAHICCTSKLLRKKRQIERIGRKIFKILDEL